MLQLLRQLSVVLLLLGCCLSQSTDFQTWKQQSGRAYISYDEETIRQQIFIARVTKIKQHNADTTKTWKMGLNKFSDMTPEEFIAMYTSSTTTAIDNVDSSVSSNRRNLQVNVTVVDWVAAGKVTPVKDMKNCGTSWIFAATAAIESGYLIKNGTNTNMSEQQILDCTPGTCWVNGNILASLNMAMTIGVKNASAYFFGYLTSDSNPCYTAGGTGGPIKITNYTNLGTGCSTFASALATGPMAVKVDLSNWQDYQSGIFNGCGTNPTFFATLVGVNDNYWTLKNSWGTTWGEAGYMRLAYGNTCSICSTSAYQPVI